MQLFEKPLCALVVLLLCGCALAQSDPGSYNDATRLYRNRTYSISCRVPAGWVLRTEQLKPDPAPATTPGQTPATNQVLLAAFERPPEASGPAPASTILIAAESQSAYLGLKLAEDYFGPLTEVVTAKGFRAVNDPYPFKIGTIQVAREDFFRETPDSKADPKNPRPTMYQSTLVALSHGAILSFTFLAASEDEVDALIDNLSLSPTASNSTPKTAPARKKK